MQYVTGFLKSQEFSWQTVWNIIECVESTRAMGRVVRVILSLRVPHFLLAPLDEMASSSL